MVGSRGREDWRRGLDAEQLAAVTHPDHPLCILAGAGSGKTRVLTRRIAWRVETGDADIRHVLVLTFTSRAASELRDRLAGLLGRDLPTAGTFHAVAYRQLRTWWQEQRRPEPALLDRKSRLVSRLLPASFPLRPATVVTELDWAQARAVGPDGYVEEVHRTGRRVPVDPERIAELFAAYEAEKRHRRVVDFDDLLTECTRVMHEDAAFARAQRWRFRHLFVDEYQDVNPLQQRLLEAWVADRSDLCVVGDPNQAIYRWNGADASYLRDFADDRPGATVVRLTTNHRSTPEIVRIADAVLDADLDPPAAAPSTNVRASHQVPAITACRDDDAEAITVARAVRAARTPGAAWAQQAVLVRTNAQATAIAALLERAGISARLRASGSLLADSTVRDALRSAGRSPLRLADWVEEFAESSTDDAALEPLLHYARRLLDEQPGAPAAALPGWATATARDDESARLRADGVDVVSFHAAKGLEWPIVHIAGLEEGYVPSSQARDEASLAEERRLLYVAVSRATRQVAFTWARRRHFGSRLVERRPSRWLRAIQEAGPSHDGAPAPADVDHVRSAREEARLALATSRPDPTCDAVRARLERWRTHVARAADVLPSVVVPDVVLSRVVAASPTTLEELIAVDGMGVSCARTYGEQMLRAVAHAEEVDA